MYAIGMSTCGIKPTEQVFADYARAGITHMEISLGNEDYDGLAWQEIRRLADLYQVTLWSVHLPFCPFEILDPSAPDETKRRYTVERFKQIMKPAASIGVDKFIIHAGMEPIADEVRIAHMAQSKRSLCELAEYADSLGATVCIEDLPRSCIGHNSDEIRELLSADERLRCCCDTNHLLTENLSDFIRAVGNRIVTLHVSDYDNVNERHWLPGEGVIDWQATLNALSDIGYSGVWMYEIGLGTPRTILRDHDVTRRDFFRNAHEIFDREPLTVFSRPKPNLGFWE